MNFCIVAPVGDFEKQYKMFLTLQIGQTETVINNLNPVFARHFYINYHFENSERLRFLIYQIDGDSERILVTLGQCECAVGELLSRGGDMTLRFVTAKVFFQSLRINVVIAGASLDVGVLNIRARPSDVTFQALRLQFCGHHMSSPVDNFPVNAYFVMLLSCEGTDLKHLLYTSESVSAKSPTWNSFVVPLSHFTPPSPGACSIEIDVYNYIANSDDKLIGKCTTSLDHLLRGTGPINTYKLSTDDRRKKDHTSVELMNIVQIASDSFIDFIKSGTQIHFSVAVDFTASNGNPLNPSSLHYIHPHNANPYMTCLCAVASVINKYNRHERIAALGFGAQIPPNFQVSHLFFMNGTTTDPHVIGVDGLMSAYRSTLYAIRPYAPTDFSEVIYHVYKFGAAANRQKTSEHYFVLLIVTDGCVTNPRKTLDAIVDCSYLPISIVISSTNGHLLKRECVTFVSYHPTMSNDQLVTKLLMNVPKQFMSWAILNGKYPGRGET
ncbi:unnamed protein product [Anisakis simplex]|uniref:C2 domain-containing protein n=1 Tax=Anisakis simplex TaxID=6269 RepID=A0A0M3K005_ANISI|nr:unnamed protein product [Anisakis simplex]